MKARYFYAPAIFSIIPKIYVLTEDLALYTEVRDCALVTIENLEADSFSNFVPSQHETEEYPILLEIEQKEALSTSLNIQANWINRYISEKGIGVSRAKQA
tara:strand:- start:1566 stop:1868 length:303 start_codon:yes stop_codon:yes gene_type:complete